MNKRSAVFIATAVVAAVVLAGGAFFIGRKSTQAPNAAKPAGNPAQAAPASFNRSKGPDWEGAPREIARYENARTIIMDISISPDGKRIVRTFQQGDPDIIDAKTGKTIKKLKSPGGQTFYASYSPDGKYIAGAVTGGVWIWDGRSGKLLGQSKGTYLGRIIRMEFSPTGKYLLSLSDEAGLKLWSVPDCFAANEFQDGITAFGISPDEKYVALCRESGNLDVVNLKTGANLGMIVGAQKSGATAMSVSPDGQWLGIAWNAGTLELWGFSPEKYEQHKGPPVIFYKKLESGKTGNYELTFSPDSRYFFASCPDRTIRVYAVAGGGMTSSISYLHDSSNGATLPFSLTADAGMLAVQSYEAEITVLSAPQAAKPTAAAGIEQRPEVAPALKLPPSVDWSKGAAVAAVLDTGAYSAGYPEFTPDGKFVSASGDQGETMIWNTADGSQLQAFAAIKAKPISVTFSPDGKRFAGAFGEEKVVKYDSNKQYTYIEPTKSFGLWDFPSCRLIKKLSVRKGTAGIVRFSPSGRFIASYNFSVEAIEIFRAPAGDAVASLDAKSLGIVDFRYSPDGLFIAAADKNNSVEVWSAASGERVSTLTGHRGAITGMQFSPDGKTIVTAAMDGSVIVWGLPGGKKIREISGAYSQCLSMAVSGDGKRVAVGPNANDCHVYGLADGKEVALLAGMDKVEKGAPITGHYAWIKKVAISPDGKYVVTASNDALSMALWDVEGGGMLTRMDKHEVRSDNYYGAPTRDINDIVWSADGQLIATAATDGKVIVWKPGG